MISPLQLEINSKDNSNIKIEEENELEKIELEEIDKLLEILPEYVGV